MCVAVAPNCTANFHWVPGGQDLPSRLIPPLALSCPAFRTAIAQGVLCCDVTLCNTLMEGSNHAVNSYGQRRVPSALPCRHPAVTMTSLTEKSACPMKVEHSAAESTGVNKSTALAPNASHHYVVHLLWPCNQMQQGKQHLDYGETHQPRLFLKSPFGLPSTPGGLLPH